MLVPKQVAGQVAEGDPRVPIGEIVAQVTDPTRELLEVEGRTVDIALPYDKVVLFTPDGDAIPLDTIPLEALPLEASPLEARP